jgi:hypothetical protein
MNHDLLDNILYVIGIAGGIAFLVAPFLHRTRACSSRHHLVAIFTAGLAATAWAIFGLLIHWVHPQMTTITFYRLHHSKDICSGIALGVLTVEFVSGEFLNSYRRDRQLRKQPPDATPSSVA